MFVPQQQQPPILLDVLRDYINSKPIKARTKASYESVIRRCYGDWLYQQMTSISRRDVQDRHRLLTIKGAYQANLAARVLRALFAFAEYYYVDSKGEPLVPANPMKVLTALELWNPETRRQRRITPDELPRWFNAVLSMPYRSGADWLLMLIFTGMRRNEATQLTFGDLDLHKGIVTVKDTKSNRPLVYPLPDVLWKLFQARFIERGCPPSTYPLFVSSNGVDPMSRYDRSYDYVCSVTGIRFSPHDLRRSFTSIATETGTHIYSIKRLLNHSNQDDGWTQGYYVQDVEHLRSCVQKICNEILRQSGMDRDELLSRLGI